MSRGRYFIIGTFILGLPCAVVLRADECTPPSSGPDAIAADLWGGQYWGTIGGISAYSHASDVLNKGDAPLPWNGQVGIAQNLYRLKNDRFEQIGMSWVKVVSGPTTDSTYCTCIPPGGPFLGVGCSDVYQGTTNGVQTTLGPRSTVNAFAGTIPTLGGSGANLLERRIQVPISDLDPALNPGATYVAELQMLSPSDAGAGNSLNNCSYQRRTTAPSAVGVGWILVPDGETVAKHPAIFEWAVVDPSVEISIIDVPQEGRFYVASRVFDHGDDTWRYEFAIFNFNSHRSARSFSVPVPDGITITDIGFRDIAYHSGEPYDGTDWVGVHENGAVTWSTDSFDVNPNANALRWGTLYNFRLDADAPPGSTVATMGLFRPGAPDTVTVVIDGPVVIVPMLSAGGLLLMGGLFAAAGWWVLRKAGRHA